MDKTGVKGILRSKSYIKLSQLLLEISSARVGPLNEDEIEVIVRHFRKYTFSGIDPLFWSLAWNSKKIKKLASLARWHLRRGASFSDDYVYSSSSHHALSYLLKNSDYSHRTKLVQQFSQAKSIKLRFTVAEFLLNERKVEQSLSQMVGILPNVGTDHAVADAISIHISSNGDKNIKKIFRKRSKEERARGNEILGNYFLWAASLI